jgi:hypothetical protein
MAGVPKVGLEHFYLRSEDPLHRTGARSASGGVRRAVKARFLGLFRGGGFVLPRKVTTGLLAVAPRFRQACVVGNITYIPLSSPSMDSTRAMGFLS